MDTNQNIYNNFKINISKSLFLTEIFLLMNLKINLMLSKSIYLISQISSIKLKIENSGAHKILFDDYCEWCNPIKLPDEIYINGINQSEIQYQYNFEHINNEIILIWHYPLEYRDCMFRGCSTITEIDLSNFDDSQLSLMHFMFYECNSLKKIEMSNIKANKVEDTGYLFGNCYNLKSINLANFYAPNNNQLHCMFENCNSLTSLNFHILI